MKLQWAKSHFNLTWKFIQTKLKIEKKFAKTQWFVFVFLDMTEKLVLPLGRTTSLTELFIFNSSLANSRRWPSTETPLTDISWSPILRPPTRSATPPGLICEMQIGNFSSFPTIGIPPLRLKSMPSSVLENTTTRVWAWVLADEVDGSGLFLASFEEVSPENYQKWMSFKNWKKIRQNKKLKKLDFLPSEKRK